MTERPLTALRVRTCVVNPKTGKPFTRHDRYEDDLHVKEYATMHDGERVPVKFGGVLACRREGCDWRQEFSY